VQDLTKMKKRIFLFLFFCINISATPTHLFSEEQADGIAFLKNQKEIVDQVIGHYNGLKTAEVLAVIAPELMRYRMFQNFIETKMLEKWYVDFGAEQADFSIGYFQMKPSFAEKLEEHLVELSSKHSIDFDHFKYTSNEEKEIRKERIERLKNFQWQLHYACLFHLVSAHCFDGLTFNSITDKIHFYATAYNLGFEKTIEEIKQWQSIEAFPYGRKFRFEQMAYGSLATHFYQSFLLQFSTKKFS